MPDSFADQIAEADAKAEMLREDAFKRMTISRTGESSDSFDRRLQAYRNRTPRVVESGESRRESGNATVNRSGWIRLYEGRV